MSRSHLPLTALRSFEAAGRHQSFTLAAGELFVSQTAISRQIRELETLLDRQLFNRYAQRVELTEQGVRLLTVLSQAFDSIESTISEISADATSFELSLSVEPAFASCWLLPRLKQFQLRNSSIEVSVETDNRVIEFRPHEPEIAIRYSALRSEWKGAASKRLYDAEFIAVISPNLSATASPALDSPESFLQFRLLHEYGERDWERWFTSAGVESGKSSKGHRYDHAGLVLQATLDGQGAAIIDGKFAAPYLETGELVQPFDISFRHGAYWIVTPKFSSLKQPAKQFVDWILGEV